MRNAAVKARPEWDLNLGQTVRDLRQAKGFTLRGLSKETGLSPSFISQLERGITRASLDSLRVISEALSTSVASLLSAAQPSGESVSYMLAADATGLDGHGHHMSGVALVRGRRAIQPLLVIGGPREFLDTYVVHASEEFIHVLAGRVQFELIGEGLYTLGPGDSLYYSAGIKHRWRQLGAKQSRYLAVLAE
jgi:transcriptional regulator with XRE-family HTH domain